MKVRIRSDIKLFVVLNKGKDSLNGKLVISNVTTERFIKVLRTGCKKRVVKSFDAVQGCLGYCIESEVSETV